MSSHISGTGTPRWISIIAIKKIKNGVVENAQCCLKTNRPTGWRKWSRAGHRILLPADRTCRSSARVAHCTGCSNGKSLIRLHCPCRESENLMVISRSVEIVKPSDTTSLKEWMTIPNSMKNSATSRGIPLSVSVTRVLSARWSSACQKPSSH